MDFKVIAKSLIVGFFGVVFHTHAQEVKPVYSVLDRHESITLHEDFTVTYQVRQKTHVQELKGLHHANIAIPYDDISRIMRFEAQVIDPKNGKTIKKISSKDLADMSDFAGGSLFQDDRVKFFGFSNEKAPMIVELSYEIKQSGNFYFNTWFPISYYHQRADHSTLEINYPEKLGLRYKVKYLDIKPDSLYTDGVVSLKWDLTNLSAFDESIGKEAARVEIYPRKFSLEGFEADMSDWNGFGAWIAQLNKGKDVVSDKLKNEIQRIVGGMEGDVEKIAALYQYLQNNYRYVSIQLGIGGWMPKPADQIFDLKYGECKGLTMLMKTMLKEVGIESQYALVRAGSDEEDINTEFSSSQFNHVFLRVPLEEKTIWLECTSKSNPVGYLGDFTKDRHVLVITDSGGFLEKTPSYSEKEYNTFQLQNRIILQENGDARIEGNYLFQGNPAANYLGLESQADLKEQKNYLNRILGGNGLLVSDFNINYSSEDFIPRARVNFQGNVQRFTQNTAKRVLIPVAWKKINREDLNYGNTLVQEEFLVVLPANLSPDGDLPTVSIEEEGIKLAIQTSLEEGVLKVFRRMEIKLEDLEEGEKDKRIQRVNTLNNRSIILKKSE